MDYLLKASGLVILLFLFYQLFLKNETFFKSIRSYFLIGLLMVISLPLIEIPIYVEYVANQFNNVEFVETSNQIVKTPQINWTFIISSIYIIGVLFFLLKFLIQLISLGYLIAKHPAVKEGKHYFIETSKNISPFSFFNIIIFNNEKFTSEELEQIINHEKAHAIQWHSLDTLLAHILVIILWFNPFVWLFKKAVEQNLEYLADKYALELAENHKLYQFTLLKTSQISYCADITNNFYNSLIKKRIIMLHKNPSTNKNQWKYALLIPLLTAFVFIFNTKTIAQEKKLVELEKVNKLKVELVIDKNSKEETLKKEQTFFKKEFNVNLTFKGIKRNSEGEITAIKITAKSKGSQANYSISGDTSINPIKISYDSENDDLEIGSGKMIHQKGYTYKIQENDNIHVTKHKNNKGNYVVVTSDEENVKLSSKDGNTVVETEKIVIRKKGDKTWVDKNENKEINIEVIKSKDGNEVVKIIEEVNEDNTSEQIYIIETDGEKGNKYKVTKKENFVFIGDNEKEPLIYIDGKEASKKEMNKLDSDKIKKIEVLKGKSATEKYGKKAKDGVILITTKN